MLYSSFVSQVYALSSPRLGAQRASQSSACSQKQSDLQASLVVCQSDTAVSISQYPGSPAEYFLEAR